MNLNSFQQRARTAMSPATRHWLGHDGSSAQGAPQPLPGRSIDVDHESASLQRERTPVYPLRVASAVVPGSVVKAGIGFGSFGVAVDARKQIPVPFVAGDGGPRIGEGSPALARQVAGLPVTDEITLKNRFDGQVDAAGGLWVFFGGPAAAFRHDDEAGTAARAKAAFDGWGGAARLAQCAASLPKP